MTRQMTKKGIARKLEQLAKSIRSGRKRVLRFDTAWERDVIGGVMTTLTLDIVDVSKRAKR